MLGRLSGKRELWQSDQCVINFEWKAKFSKIEIILRLESPIGKGSERICDVLINYLSHISPSLSDSIDLSPTYLEEGGCNTAKQRKRPGATDRVLDQPFTVWLHWLLFSFYCASKKCLLYAVQCTVYLSATPWCLTNCIALLSTAMHSAPYFSAVFSQFCFAVHQDTVEQSAMHWKLSAGWSVAAPPTLIKSWDFVERIIQHYYHHLPARSVENMKRNDAPS